MKKLCLAFLIVLGTLPLVNGQSSLRIDNQQFKDQFLTIINAKRAKGCNCGGVFMKPVSPLTWNDLLAQSATEHAKDMYKHNYFNHESKDGSTSEDRIIKAGYIYKGYQKYTTGENIAYGQQSILEVLANWFKSDGHCKNIMNPDFKEIGVAEYNYYWVQDFGGRVSFAAH